MNTLKELGYVARDYLACGPRPGPQLVWAGVGLRIAAAAIDVVAIAILGGFVSYFGLLGVFFVLHCFDGPDVDGPLLDWAFLNLLTLWTIVYWTSEVLFQKSLGKRLFKLSVHATIRESQGKRLALRWAIKCAPLIAAQVCLVVGLWLTAADSYDRYRHWKSGHGWLIEVAAWVIVVAYAAQLAIMALACGRTLHDALAGTEVLRPHRPTTNGQHGFEPILTNAIGGELRDKAQEIRLVDCGDPNMVKGMELRSSKNALPLAEL